MVPNLLISKVMSVTPIEYQDRGSLITLKGGGSKGSLFPSINNTVKFLMKCNLTF